MIFILEPKTDPKLTELANDAIRQEIVADVKTACTLFSTSMPTV